MVNVAACGMRSTVMFLQNSPETEFYNHFFPGNDAKLESFSVFSKILEQFWREL